MIMLIYRNELFFEEFDLLRVCFNILFLLRLCVWIFVVLCIVGKVLGLIENNIIKVRISFVYWIIVL